MKADDCASLFKGSDDRVCLYRIVPHYADTLCQYLPISTDITYLRNEEPSRRTGGDSQKKVLLRSRD